MTTLQVLDLTPEEKERGVWLSGFKGEGQYKHWYISGQLMTDANFKNGQKHGRCVIFDFDGIAMIDETFEEGVAVSTTYAPWFNLTFKTKS